jgi:hypothetical protein
MRKQTGTLVTILELPPITMISTILSAALTGIEQEEQYK